jgi:hypothetical protein
MPPDPTMARVMPESVERALREVLGWRNAAAAPIDFNMAIYDVLVAAEEESGTAVKAGD